MPVFLAPKTAKQLRTANTAPIEPPTPKTTTKTPGIARCFLLVAVTGSLRGEKDPATDEDGQHRLELVNP